MAVTLLRHTAPAVAPGTCYGITDLPLADSFDAEARAVLATLPLAGAVITSPLRRCRLLAGHLAQARGLPLTVVAEWREMDFGAWEGVAWDAVPRDGLDAWAEDFMGYDGHGGESVARLLDRVTAALAAAPDGALIVTHMGCIRAALAARGHPGAWDARIGFGGHLML